MTKLIGYARVSTRQQSTDRQQTDLLAAGVRRDDLYVDQGVSGARSSRPQFDRALDALLAGDTLVITTLDRLGRSTQNMLAFADDLRARGAGLRVLNLGGGDVDWRHQWVRCCSRLWPLSRKWNTRSNANALPTP
jgi:DNA invertase Pin-like site-specific DNA recombinase